MNKTKPDNIPAWKTQGVLLVAEQLWQLVAAEREIHCPQGWGLEEKLSKVPGDAPVQT